MIQARIQQGRIEAQEPIPAQWEGQLVKVVPLTPDDLLLDLEVQLAILEKLGPVEFEPEERTLVAEMFEQLDRAGRDAMQRIARRKP
jgi:hypothetical protein